MKKSYADISDDLIEDYSKIATNKMKDIESRWVRVMEEFFDNNDDLDYIVIGEYPLSKGDYVYGDEKSLNNFITYVNSDKNFIIIDLYPPNLLRNEKDIQEKFEKIIETKIKFLSTKLRNLKSTKKSLPGILFAYKQFTTMRKYKIYLKAIISSFNKIGIEKFLVWGKKITAPKRQKFKKQVKDIMSRLDDFEERPFKI